MSGPEMVFSKRFCKNTRSRLTFRIYGSVLFLPIYNIIGKDNKYTKLKKVFVDRKVSSPKQGGNMVHQVLGIKIKTI